jgi:hypothetical protein
MACAAQDAREDLAVQSFSVVRGSKKKFNGCFCGHTEKIRAIALR